MKELKRPLGVRAIVTFLRAVYPHRVLGAEKLTAYEQGDVLFICNHGEIYGPVAAMLYVPTVFRPWVFSRMMEKDAIVEHMYYGTMERQKWLPEAWKRPLLRKIAPFLVYLFEGVHAIPVYRGHPKELMKTFRVTLDAMRDGHNILIFPENADEHEEGKSGFIKDGVGDFYTGFAMLGMMHWARNKRRAVFVPVYANKKKRTVTIGDGIAFDPENATNEEKLRIAQTLHNALSAMAGE